MKSNDNVIHFVDDGPINRKKQSFLISDFTCRNMLQADKDFYQYSRRLFYTVCSREKGDLEFLRRIGYLHIL